MEYLITTTEIRHIFNRLLRNKIKKREIRNNINNDKPVSPKPIYCQANLILK